VLTSKDLAASLRELSTAANNLAGRVAGNGALEALPLADAMVRVAGLTAGVRKLAVRLQDGGATPRGGD
jgi:hypothetical protein